MPELKLYTVADLREWLTNNHPAEGLSERVIAPTRAWAIVHNPYVKEEDAIVAAIFEDGELAAYTASFPDKLDGKRVWWCSTLYCYPQFAGRGYGMIVVGSLMEAHEPDLTYDRWGAQETIEIFKALGLQTTYTKRYHLSDKRIDTSTLKGKLAYYAQELKKCLRPWSKKLRADCTIHYASFIDDEAFAFIKAHCKNYLWLREQDMLNWIVTNPFRKNGLLKEGKGNECIFGDESQVYEYKIAKVYIDEQLQGVYVLRRHDDELSVIYLYYTYEKREVVFDSLINYVVAQHPKSFVTENPFLFERVRESLYFPKSAEEKVSLCMPEIKGEYSMQMGDGDSFA